MNTIGLIIGPNCNRNAFIGVIVNSKEPPKYVHADNQESLEWLFPHFQIIDLLNTWSISFSWFQIFSIYGKQNNEHHHNSRLTLVIHYAHIIGPTNVWKSDAVMTY